MVRRLKLIGLVLAAFALASSGPAPAPLPYQLIDRPEVDGLSLRFENKAKETVCVREDWPFHSGPNGGPVVLEVAGRRFPLRPIEWALCEKNCIDRLPTGNARGWNLPYTAFELPKELADAPKTVDASLMSESCKGTKLLPEERYKTSDWIPVGSTEKQICATFREVTRWDNRETVKNARFMGERVGVLVKDYDREQFPGGSIYDYYLPMSDSQLADPAEANGRRFRFYILAEHRRAKGASIVERMRLLLISALPPATEVRDFSGLGESLQLKQSHAIGTYMPAMCRLQTLCRAYGVVPTANKLPCGDLGAPAA
jgi:hypothetical protein